MRPLIEELKARQRDQAEKAIESQLQAVSVSREPSMDYCAGMIDLAYAMGHLGKERRDSLLEQLRQTVNKRRGELHQQRISRILEVKA